MNSSPLDSPRSTRPMTTAETAMTTRTNSVLVNVCLRLYQTTFFSSLFITFQNFLSEAPILLKKPFFSVFFLPLASAFDFFASSFAAVSLFSVLAGDSCSAFWTGSSWTTAEEFSETELSSTAPYFFRFSLSAIILLLIWFLYGGCAYGKNDNIYSFQVCQGRFSCFW